MGSEAQGSRAHADTLAIAIALSHKILLSTSAKLWQANMLAESQITTIFDSFGNETGMAFSKSEYEGLMG